MSTRNQKRRAGASIEEPVETQTEVGPRISSVVIGEEVSLDLDPLTDTVIPQETQSLESLKASLRKEITEEVKSLLEQSQRELILAIKSSNLEKRPCTEDEILGTPISNTATPTKTVRFGIAGPSAGERNTYLTTLS